MSRIILITFIFGALSTILVDNTPLYNPIEPQVLSKGYGPFINNPEGRSSRKARHSYKLQDVFLPGKYGQIDGTHKIDCLPTMKPPPEMRLRLKKAVAECVRSSLIKAMNFGRDMPCEEIRAVLLSYMSPPIQRRLHSATSGHVPIQVYQDTMNKPENGSLEDDAEDIDTPSRQKRESNSAQFGAKPEQEPYPDEPEPLPENTLQQLEAEPETLPELEPGKEPLTKDSSEPKQMTEKEPELLERKPSALRSLDEYTSLDNRDWPTATQNVIKTTLSEKIINSVEATMQQIEVVKEFGKGSTQDPPHADDDEYSIHIDELDGVDELNFIAEMLGGAFGGQNENPYTMVLPIFGSKAMFTMDTHGTNSEGDSEDYQDGEEAMGSRPWHLPSPTTSKEPVSNFITHMMLNKLGEYMQSCVVQKLDLVDEVGKFNPELFKHFIALGFENKEDEDLKLLSNFIDKCAEETEDMDEAIRPQTFSTLCFEPMISEICQVRNHYMSDPTTVVVNSLTINVKDKKDDKHGIKNTITDITEVDYDEDYYDDDNYDDDEDNQVTIQPRLGISGKKSCIPKKRNAVDTRRSIDTVGTGISNKGDTGSSEDHDDSDVISTKSHGYDGRRKIYFPGERRSIMEKPSITEDTDETPSTTDEVGKDPSVTGESTEIEDQLDAPSAEVDDDSAKSANPEKPTENQISKPSTDINKSPNESLPETQLHEGSNDSNEDSTTDPTSSENDSTTTAIEESIEEYPDEDPSFSFGLGFGLS